MVNILNHNIDKNYIYIIYIVSAEYIHSCRKADVQFNSCIKETFNHLRPYLINGIL